MRRAALGVQRYPCLFSPERVTDFPHPRELDDELRDQLDDVRRWEAVDPAQYSTYADDLGELSLGDLSTAPGWKTGGWISWGDIDPDCTRRLVSSKVLA